MFENNWFWSDYTSLGISNAPYPRHRRDNISDDELSLMIALVLSLLLVLIMYFYYKHKWTETPFKQSIKRTRYRRILIYLFVDLTLFTIKIYQSNPFL